MTDFEDDDVTEYKNVVKAIWNTYSATQIKERADFMQSMVDWLKLVAYEKERQEEKMMRHDRARLTKLNQT